MAESYPQVIAMKASEDGSWKTWTYHQFYDDVQTVAKAFIEVGLHRHHSVAIMGSNSPQWVIAKLGAIFAG